MATALVKIGPDGIAPLTDLLKDKKSDLAGLVDPHEIGVAGHSHGGVTTLGLAANTCCHDDRVKAAIVLSGDSLTFPKGEFDYAQAGSDATTRFDGAGASASSARSRTGIAVALAPPDDPCSPARSPLL